MLRLERRKGGYFNCKNCGEVFYRRPSHVRRGITKTCGKRECISAVTMGENNPYWGKNHSPEVRAIIKEKRRKARRPKIIRGPDDKPHGPLKGSYVASKEAREKISEAVRRDWRVNRDKRLAACAKSGETQRLNHICKEPRHRLRFTPMQKRDWQDTKCAWCDETQDLVLDHILPVMAGGKNTRANAQTLCRKCNLWKMRYIDRPLFLSILDNKGAIL